MIDLIDALRELLEPSSLDDPAIAASGTRLDRSCAQPFTFEPDTLYAYEELDQRILEETYAESIIEPGAFVGVERQNFTIVFVYSADGTGENAAMKRERAVSIALDDRRNGYLRLLKDHRTHGDLWHHLAGSADADYVRQLEVRGIAVRITGYRFVS